MNSDTRDKRQEPLVPETFSCLSSHLSRLLTYIYNLTKTITSTERLTLLPIFSYWFEFLNNMVSEGVIPLVFRILDLKLPINFDYCLRFCRCKTGK